MSQAIKHNEVIPCGKCSYYHEYENAPIGKIVTHIHYGPDAGKNVQSDCNACKGTGEISEVIINSIKLLYPEKAESILSSMKWHGDHYGFMLGTMYVGCELDGFLHT